MHLLPSLPLSLPPSCRPRRATHMAACDENDDAHTAVDGARRPVTLGDLLPAPARHERPPTTLADLDLLSLGLLLALVPDPAAAAAAAATCTHLARAGGGPVGAKGGAQGGPGPALWRSLAVDARGVPDSRAAPRGARAPASILAAPPGPRTRLSSRSTRGAALELARWLGAGRGDAAEELSLAWHPAIAASAAVADAALAGCAARLTALTLDAGPAGALASLPKPLLAPGRRPLRCLTIRAGSLDAGAVTDATGGPPHALAGLERLAIHAALTGWAPLLPPPGRGPQARGWGPAALASLRSLDLVLGSGLREVPAALAAAPSLTRLAIAGGRLGRDRWSSAATGASSAWSPTAALAGGPATTLVELVLEDCGLETVPAEVAACTRLARLGLARNALRSFSCEALRGLPCLTDLDLRANALGGPLPAGLVGTWRAGVVVRVEGNPYLKRRQAGR